MPQSPGDPPVGRCLSCGQPALLPDTLDVMVICPRCGTEAKASDLLLPPSPTGAKRDKALDPDFVNAPTILAMPAPSGDAPDAPEIPSADGKALGARFLACLDSTNRYVAGRRRRLAGLFVVLCGVGGPFADWLCANEHPVYAVLLGNVLLFVLWLLCFAWILSLRNRDGTWNGLLLGTHLKVAWTGFWESLFELSDSSTPFRLTRSGAALFEFGCLLIAGCSIASVFTVVANSSAAAGSWFQLSWWSGVAGVALGLVLLAWAKFSNRNPTVKVTPDARADVEAPPAIIDLRATTEVRWGGAEPLPQILILLSKWNDRKIRHYDTEYAYQAALERHFRRHASALFCRRGVWLGKTRAEGVVDFVLGGLVLVDVRKGLDKAAAERAKTQLLRYPPQWSTKPKLLLVFDADQRELVEGGVTPMLEQLHAQCGITTVGL